MRSSFPGENGIVRPAAARRHVFIAALVLAVLLATQLPVAALECRACGAGGLSALAMYCPRCRAGLHTPQIQRAVRASAVLAIDISYTGDNPERLPEYGKIYINGVYKGNIPLLEREARRKDLDVSSHRGLGYDYTAKYHADLRELDVGVFRVEVEMKFKRFYGFVRSIRKVCFPYVALRSGEKTAITHTFKRGSSFQNRTIASSTPFLQIFPGLPGIPALNELMKLTPGSGTLGIEMPFFD